MSLHQLPTGWVSEYGACFRGGQAETSGALPFESGAIPDELYINYGLERLFVLKVLAEKIRQRPHGCHMARRFWQQLLGNLKRVFCSPPPPPQRKRLSGRGVSRASLAASHPPHHASAPYPARKPPLCCRSERLGVPHLDLFLRQYNIFLEPETIALLLSMFPEAGKESCAACSRGPGRSDTPADAHAAEDGTVPLPIFMATVDEDNFPLEPPIDPMQPSSEW